ncbi:MAG TPA: hypothetical protein VKA65_12410 [Acidimicrobiales bacterium]|nr:hypothetical protein [Acidimicrobiales bacterium]
MRILCIETTPGLADATAARLGAAGHEVVRCFDRDAGPSRPCVGLDRDACPLDLPGGVDVAVDVRSEDEPHPVVHEQGTTCAVRRHVPLVVHGAGWPNPFARWTTVAVSDGDVVDACEDAVRRHLNDLAATAAIVTRRVVDDGLQGAGGDVRAAVDRRGRDLRVVVHRPAAASTSDGAIAARIHQAFRAAGVDDESISISCVA